MGLVAGLGVAGGNAYGEPGSGSGRLKSFTAEACPESAGWRTGGTVEEIIAESHIDPEHIWEGIQAFIQRPTE